MVTTLNDYSGRIDSLMQNLEIPSSAREGIAKTVHFSETVLSQMRLVAEQTDQELQDRGECLIGFGSLARLELTPASDLDYLFVGDGLSDDRSSELYSDLIVKIRSGAGVCLRNPGSSGVFGCHIEASPLVEHIGLQDDTNHNLTRRLVLIEESVPLANSAAHRQLLNEVFLRYLEARIHPSSKIPRVLLNDIIRYWRTVAVDYHAKTATNPGYSLRYLKLLFSRKLCFLSSLAPLHQMSLAMPSDEQSYLMEAYSTPALVRLIKWFDFLGREDAKAKRLIQSSLERYWRFLRLFSSPESRGDLEAEIRREDHLQRESAFYALRQDGKALHKDVSALLTTEVLLDFTKEYMLS